MGSRKRTKKQRNEDLCDYCDKPGTLARCDSCPASFHLLCHTPELESFPEGDWECYRCTWKAHYALNPVRYRSHISVNGKRVKLEDPQATYQQALFKQYMQTCRIVPFSIPTELKQKMKKDFPSPEKREYDIVRSEQVWTIGSIIWVAGDPADLMDEEATIPYLMENTKSKMRFKDDRACIRFDNVREGCDGTSRAFASPPYRLILSFKNPACFLKMPDSAPLNAIVVVLGDVGHSPRTCYHASSLAAHGLHVDLVGYSNSQPHPEILNNERIRIVPLASPPKIFSHPKCPRVLQFLLKIVVMSFSLLGALFFRTSFRSSILLMQNPPGIPTMMICWLMSCLKSATFIIDWHNYTYTILQQTQRPAAANNTTKNAARPPANKQNWVVRLAHWWEGHFGRKAKYNICVSNTMRNDLKARWNINSIMLHDKSPLWNVTDAALRFDFAQQHAFFRRLFNTPSFAAYSSMIDSSREFKESTLFTGLKTNGEVVLRDDRPLFLVSSTSWTEDEDFGILLDALKEYDKTAEIQNSCTEKPILPKLFVVITGKGPQKEFYMKKVGKMRMKYVDVISAWLEAVDYPRVLACADLGVSLHTSSSGLDLPMKIVDMHGLALPVLAKRFNAIDEQIIEGVNGRLFDTPHQLRQVLVELATEFPNNRALNDLKKHMRGENRVNWHAQWDALLWPIIESILHRPQTEQRRWDRFQIGPEDVAGDARNEAEHHLAETEEDEEEDEN